MEPSNLENLIDRCLDGIADDDERRQLTAALRCDSSVRDQYVAACRLRAAVADRLGNPPLAAATDTVSCAKTHRTGRGLGWTLAMAAMLLTAVGLATAIAWPTGDGGADLTASVPEPGNPSHDAGSAAPVVAHIVRKIDCVWNDQAWQLDSQLTVRGGQTIHLERGFMQLLFVNGVSVVIEGPAQFKLIDGMNSQLEFGAVAVRVPEGFANFVVDTPTANVVDLGTEFGVRVRRNGATHLRVFDGEVAVSERVGRGIVADESIVLKRDDEWNSIDGLRVPEGPPSVEDFPHVELLEDPNPNGEAKLPVTDELLLWLSADQAVRTDSKGRVVSWGDLSTADPIRRHSAWQVEAHRRPLLVDGEHGRPPVFRFDGKDDCLITEPFVSGNAQTLVVVGRLHTKKGKVAKSGDIPAFQFINYNGPPHLVLEYRWPESALQGRAFAGYDVKMNRSGNVAARSIAKQELLAMIYTYDFHGDEATLWLNGELQGRARAGLEIGNNRPRVIGLHRRLDRGGLKGEISEIAIYDRVLANSEIRQMISYLDERYGPLTVAAESQQPPAEN